MQGIQKAFSLSKDDVLRSLDSSQEGLPSKEAEKRLKIFGKNRLKHYRQNKFFLLCKQFNNLFIYILLAAAGISLATGKKVDFFVIVSLVLVNGLISFWQELKAILSIEELQKLTETQMKVFRSGKIVKIPSSLCVPGDYVFISEGDQITADIRLCEGESTQVDESLLTGESIPVTKDGSLILSENTPAYEQMNMLFSGTSCTKGFARGVVTATGQNTYIASIAEAIKEPSTISPLMKALNFFSKRYVVLLMILLSCIGILGYFQGRSFFDLAYVLIAYLVSAVPEGLPIVITLVLVVGSLAMSRKKTLVRYLPAVETLGSASVLAIDKTGTITGGKVAVEKFFAFDEQRLKLAAMLCNDAFRGHVDPIDHALAQWGENFEEIQKNFPRLFTWPFDVKHRMMATAHQMQGKKILFVKGAFEQLELMDEDEQRKEILHSYVEKFSKEGLRVLAIGEGEFVDEKMSLYKRKIKLLGVVGFLDPPKSGVKEAVLEAKRAKIRVLMITGDHKETAQKIAEDVGIFTKGDVILTGRDLDQMDDETLFQTLKKTSVLARSLPEHKLRIVEIFQKRNEIVVVTGDGVNDVSALKVADLGIAMGSGAEAAIAVSKMVIKDNNVKVIVEAVRNARIIADNIRKVISYLLSASLMEIVLLALSIFLGYPQPLYAAQILWINLVTESSQDKTFAFIKEDGDVMKRAPRLPISQFFDRSQVFKILSFGCIVGFLAFFLFVHLLKNHPYHKTVAILFTSIAAAQWVNGLQAQKEKPFFKNVKKSLSINPFIFMGIAIGLCLQLFAIYGLQELLHLQPLTLKDWMWPLLFACMTFMVIEGRKWLELFWRNQKVRIGSIYSKKGKSLE